MGGNRFFRASTHDDREELQENKRESQYKVHKDSIGFEETRSARRETAKEVGGHRLPVSPASHLDDPRQ